MQMASNYILILSDDKNVICTIKWRYTLNMQIVWLLFFLLTSNIVTVIILLVV